MKSIFPQNFQDIVLFSSGIQHGCCDCQCHSVSECDFYMIFSYTLRAVWNLALMWSLLFLVSSISYEYSLWRASLFTSEKCVIYLFVFDHFFLCFPFSGSLICQMSGLGFLPYSFFFLLSFLSFCSEFFSTFNILNEFFVVENF